MQAINSILGPRNKEFKILIPKTPRRIPTQLSTNSLADYLVDKFKSPEFRPLFLKVAWRLDRGSIDRYVASAFELGRNPRAYFIKLVKQDDAYIGGDVESRTRVTTT